LFFTQFYANPTQVSRGLRASTFETLIYMSFNSLEAWRGFDASGILIDVLVDAPRRMEKQGTGLPRRAAATRRVPAV